MICSLAIAKLSTQHHQYNHQIFNNVPLYYVLFGLSIYFTSAVAMISGELLFVGIAKTRVEILRNLGFYGVYIRNKTPNGYTIAMKYYNKPFILYTLFAIYLLIFFCRGKG